jgi:hypothetical protein
MNVCDEWVGWGFAQKEERARMRERERKERGHAALNINMMNGRMVRISRA